MQRALTTGCLAMAVLIPLRAWAEPPVAQQMSDRVAAKVSATLDTLREAIAETALRPVLLRVCREPLAGLREQARTAQEAQLDLELALAAQDAEEVSSAAERVEHSRRHALELGEHVHACVERERRSAPIPAWSRTSTTWAAPSSMRVESSLDASWPPPPPHLGPAVAVVPPFVD